MIFRWRTPQGSRAFATPSRRRDPGIYPDDQAELCGGGHRWHCGAGAGQHWPGCGDAGHGRQGDALQGVAGVDAFPICLDTRIDKIVETVKMIAPAFGGINLEDISAPRCFEIEERLGRSSTFRSSMTISTAPRSSSGRPPQCAPDRQEGDPADPGCGHRRRRGGNRDHQNPARPWGVGHHRGRRARDHPSRPGRGIDFMKTWVASTTNPAM